MASFRPITLPSTVEIAPSVSRPSFPSVAPKIAPTENGSATLAVGGGAGSMHGSMGSTRFPTPVELPKTKPPVVQSATSSSAPFNLDGINSDLETIEKNAFKILHPIAIVGILIASFIVIVYLCFHCGKKFTSQRRKGTFSASEAKVSVTLADNAREIT